MSTEIGIRLSLDGDQKVTSALSSVEKSVSNLGSQIGGLVKLGGAIFVIPQALDSVAGGAIRAADSVTILGNQLKLATGDFKGAAHAYGELFSIAQRSRVNFLELGNTFASLSRAGDALGISQSRLLKVTEAISNAVTVSGGSAEAAQAALTQLGQGLASGALRGDELNSVMEQTPRLAKALADGLGISIGQLRKLGQEGKITSDAVINALESQTKTLSTEVANSVMTVGQAFTQLKNSAVKLVGDFDSVTGASHSLAQNLSAVSKSADTLGSVIKENGDAINTTIGVLAGAATAAGIGAVASRMATLSTSVGGITGALVILRTTIASLNPWTLALLGGGAVVGGLVAKHEEFSKTKQGIEEKIAYLERLSQVDKSSLERAGVDPSANKFFLKALDERTAKIAALTKDLQVFTQAERDALAPVGSVPSGDTLLRREQARAAAQKALNAPTKSGPSEYEKSIARGKKLYSDLIDQNSGLSPDFAEKWSDLANAHKADATSVKDLALAQKELLLQQPFAKEQAKEQEDSAKAASKAYAEEQKAYEEKIKALDNSAGSMAAQVQRLQDEDTATAMAAAQNISLAVAIEEVGLSRVRETYAKEAAANSDGQTLLALQMEINSRKKIITLMGDKETRTANAEAAKKAGEDWKKTAELIESNITDALMRGWDAGKGFAENFRDTVVNMFKTMVLRPIVSAIVSPVAGALTGAMGISTAANAAGTVGDAASAINGASMLSSMKGWMTDFGSSATSALYSAGEKVYQLGFESLGKSMMGNINEAGGFTAMADKLNMVGNSLGYLNATMLAAGGQWGAAIGAGIGTYFGGPIGSMIGQAVGGWVDNAFGGGHEYTTGTGIQGKFSSSGFSGNAYQTWRNDGSSGLLGIGGSGSSSGKNLSALDAAMQSGLSGGFMSIQVAAAGMSKALGLDAKQIEGYSKDISVALGSDAAANQKAISDMLSGVADGLALSLAPQIADFAKSGETASGTLARLATSIITANSWLSMLRQRMFQVSLAGGDAASRLADAFGGLDNLAASSKAFYDTYYTSGEKVANSQKAMTEALGAFGIALPESKQALKDLAGSLDLNTDAGRAAYATLLKLAPEFATTADLIDTASRDAATALLKTFSGNGELIPALDATNLSMTGMQAGADAVVSAMTQIHTVMGDVSSPILTFSDSVTTLSTDLTGAQASALLLQSQIFDLGIQADKTVINFDGLTTALKTVDTTTFMETIAQVFTSLAGRISNVIDGIKTERIAVRDAALQIVGPTVMSKQNIQSGISGINSTMPGNAGLISANAALGAANSAQSSAQAAAITAATAVSNAANEKSSLIANYASMNAQLRALGSAYSPAGTSITFDSASSGDNAAYNYNAGSNALNPYSYMTYKGYTNTMSNLFGSASTTYLPDTTGLKANPQYRNLLNALDTGNAALAAAAQKITATQNASNAAQSASASATAAQANAAAAAAKAILDYQSALQSFTLDAGKSVTKLSNLRQETVKYYEAQKALADLMSTSAINLLATVSNYRFSQLSPEAQTASLQAQFATAYSMAQASQGDGTTLAGYGDKINSMLGPLIDKLNETGKSSLITNYLSQAEVVAKLLEDNAPKNYSADSLAMLGNIDATLAALDASSKSAERIISEAVRAGSDRTAAGLHAVIAAITGQAVPAFATGAAFSRGGSVIKRPSLFNMGQMAETGPEAIMPLTNINGSLGVRMSGGGFDALTQQMQELNRKVERMAAESQATAIATGKTAKLLDGVVRGGDSINTVAAV
jgi:tape measure domain-containing protein